MITVEEAERIIDAQCQDFGIEEISLASSLGRILREPIYADRDFPPYDRVTMDGIAIVFDQFKSGQRIFPIEGVAAAGDTQKTLKSAENCLEVMTGAIMPAVVDTVIPYEQLTIADGVATINLEELTQKQNIHFKGLDRKKGDLIIDKGIRMSSSEVGVCSTVGKARIQVSRLPKTVVISSGDELVEIDENPLPHQIRKSNVYRLTTVLKSYNIDVKTAHLADDYKAILATLKGYLERYDLIILSGGVSMGKFDFLPQALEELKVEKLFHKIKQRPGKPFWFGKYKDKTTVFAFPGNPVSSFMCMQQYFKPWLDESLQFRGKKMMKAKLAEEVYFKPDLTYFLEVNLSFNDLGEIVAYPAKGNGSGDLANLVEAEAFIQLPRGRDTFEKGEVFPIILYRDIF